MNAHLLELPLPIRIAIRMIRRRPWQSLLAVMTLRVVGDLSALAPALRALRVHPVTALRSE